MNQIRKLLEIKALTQTICQNGNTDSTNTQIKVLYFIDEYKQTSPQILISKLGINKSNLAILMKKMIADGYVESNKGSIDKRSIFYSITEKGKNLLDEYLQKLDEVINSNDFTDDLCNALNTIITFLNKKI